MMESSATESELLDHARSSRWRGHLVGATHGVRIRNRTCGDELAFSLQIQDGRVSDLRFQGKGCFVSQAAASLVCEHSVGRALADLTTDNPLELLGFDPASLSPLRQRCCLLGWAALHRLAESAGAKAPTTTDPALTITLFTPAQEPPHA